ncbi:MFS transporter [Nocardioides sp. dk4132]|uniref:MFS transporter n=1 Tax=unclassified Nocardioides TaxID=2615069 RepID=UPI0012971A0E|nr:MULTISPECIES: MFS transporter [unclassified Nocardioides]MQW77625.1 MFS transporter [Nocardioides sp. dk4132]QGA06151.1 MFS transporter [Nocardioides sp. dk884]
MQHEQVPEAVTAPDERLDPGGQTAPTPSPTHRELLVAVSGVMLAMFVALISGTVVINALPRIVPDLGGSQTAYTWVVVANMLTITATTPLWGKLADQLNIEHLIRAALLVYVVGNLIGMLAQDIPTMITARAIQGVGIGGLVALSAAVIARLVPPRERGRFTGYQNMCWATGTIAGPVVGGIIADSPLGWRGCFLIGLPFAAASMALMSRTLRIPHQSRPVKVDLLGGLLVVAGISLLLALLSLGGSRFPWASSTTVALALAAAAVIAAVVFVELKVATEPIIRFGLFRGRTVALATATAALVGMAMLAATVYLGEYYQYSRGLDPMDAGLLTAPMVAALAATGVINGRIVSATARWKPMCLFGCAVVALGVAMIGSVDHATPVPFVALSSAVLGIGLGASTANLMVAVQTIVDPDEVGSASSLVTFAQSLGGTVSIAILGTYLGSRVASETPEIGHSLPDPATLPDALRATYQQVVGDTIGDLFLFMTPIAALAVVLALLIPGTRLRSTH